MIATPFNLLPCPKVFPAARMFAITPPWLLLSRVIFTKPGPAISKAAISFRAFKPATIISAILRGAIPDGLESANAIDVA